MERRDFIPILECALKSVDPHVIEVSQDPNDPDEIQVFLDDCSTIAVGVHGMPLLDILGFTALGLRTEHLKDRLKIKAQRITRRGIRFEGEWYSTKKILMYHGQSVYVIPSGKVLMIQDMDGRLIETIDLS